MKNNNNHPLIKNNAEQNVCIPHTTETASQSHTHKSARKKTSFILNNFTILFDRVTIFTSSAVPPPPPPPGGINRHTIRVVCRIDSPRIPSSRLIQLSQLPK
eukprot:GHVL01034915.1.p1 GENE.GHVL01034915.1~~GHVL01034915.1.p1  ORF type:complete len:102 (-),score=20.64 GHVL01034915.1:211-516(-)